MWRTARSLDLDRDIEVTHADMARPDGQVLGLRRAGKAGEPPHVEDVRDWLEPSDPNPFNPSTALRYAIGRDGHVWLRIYDMRGRLVRTLVSGAQRRGVYRVIWDGTNTSGEASPSGIYIARLTTSEGGKSQKLALVR
jgi:hypothetical protein